MNFLQPLFFWTFLSLIPLAAIYFLKVRPTRKPTTAYFLWRTIFHEKRSTALFNRLRDLWSLLLNVILVSAVVLAMTGPEWTDDERKDLLLLIDRSVSMSAIDAGKTRLESAKEVAAGIVKALDGNQRAAVATVDRELSYRAHFTTDPRELLEAIDGIEESDLPFRAESLNSVTNDSPVASGVAGSASERKNDDHRILLLSDGCSGDRRPPPVPIELLKIGGPQGNVGIVRCDLQVLPGERQTLGLYFQIASSFPEAIEAELTLSHGAQENIVKVIPLSLQPGVNKPETYRIDDVTPGRWIARLETEGDDRLFRDNVAFLTVAAPRPVRVAVDAEAPYFYERSVLSFAETSGLLTLDTENPELVVATRRTPEAPLSVIFHPDGSSPWWEDVGDEVEGIVARVVAEEHPALRHCDVSTMSFVGARELSPPAGALILVASDQGLPLIYRARKDERTAVVVNMNPALGDFFFSAWFPVLIYSSATHLGGREETLAATYPTGATIVAPGFQEGEATTVRHPDATQETLLTRTLGPIRSAGFHTVSSKAGEWLVGASVLAAAESLLDNADALDTSQPIHRGSSLGALLTVFAILLLVFESLLYHRRKVG